MLTFAAALIASFLPKRHWPRFPSLPISAAAPVAALVTFMAAVVLGIGNFISYADGVMSGTGQLQLAIAERQIKGELPETAAVSTGPMAVALLSPLAFLFLTPAGQLSTYFGLTSLVRCFVWVVDGPTGEPVLTAVDATAARVTARLRTTRAQHTRRRQEGALVPDRLYDASWARLHDADFVVVASRRKAEWRPGATIVTASDWFTVGVPYDLHTREGLRTVYPLKKQRETDVVRGAVQYRLPPLSRS